MRNVLASGAQTALAMALAAVALLAGAGSAAASAPRAAGAASLAPALSSLIRDEVAQAPSIPGEILAVDVPPLGLRFRGAAGRVALGGATPLTADRPFRIASVMKTFTAAATLRLVEDGRLRLGDSIATRLPHSYVTLLAKGGYDPRAITVRQLLLHTSGIYDYSFGQGSHFVQDVLAHPHKRWTPFEQVRYAVDHGKPTGRPGQTFAYTDTEYVLLGQIIVRSTGRPLAESYRRLLSFDRLGMSHTFLESLEPKPRGLPALAHQYLGTVDLTSFDPSFDLYGGGGLVSTVGDLVLFMQALTTGHVFHHQKTLATMLTVPPSNRGVNFEGGPYGRPDAGMGIFKLQVAGYSCLWHAGFWGVDMVACPALKLVLARTSNQGVPALQPMALLTRVVTLIANAETSHREP